MSTPETDQPADDGVSYAETYAIATAVATHPEGTVLDDNGDPVLDDDGNAVTE